MTMHMQKKFEHCLDLYLRPLASQQNDFPRQLRIVTASG